MSMIADNHRFGTLYIIATPIGNVADISQRACQLLAEVALIVAEDTRHSGRLLDKLGIRQPLLSYHANNEQARLQSLLTRLRAGQDIALISDAGTPLISDPGYLLVRACREAGIAVLPVPGACALTAALSVAGLAVGRFVFEGFLPSRRNTRKTHMRSLFYETRTLVFYESVHRMSAFLVDACAVFGDEREVVLARELTKRHEQIVHGKLAEVKERFGNDIPERGEFVVLLQGQKLIMPEQQQVLHVLDILLEENSLRDAVSLASRITGCNRNEVYRLACEQAEKNNVSE